MGAAFFSLMPSLAIHTISIFFINLLVEDIYPLLNKRKMPFGKGSLAPGFFAAVSESSVSAEVTDGKVHE